MTELLGRKLSSVLEELKRENRETVVVPTSSKKGSGGSDTRVIRVRDWSVFGYYQALAVKMNE